MSEPLTESDMAKLPKWAREHIRDVNRERDIAIRALNKYVDSQTPSPFLIEELESTGEKTGPSFKVRYIQTHRIAVRYAGIYLDVKLPLRGEKHISLQWSAEDRSCRDIAMIPESFCQVRLVTKEAMS